MSSSFGRILQGSRIFQSCHHLQTFTSHLLPPINSWSATPLSSDNSYFLLHQNSKTTRFTFFILVLCPLNSTYIFTHFPQFHRKGSHSPVFMILVLLLPSRHWFNCPSPLLTLTASFPNKQAQLPLIPV